MTNIRHPQNCMMCPVRNDSLFCDFDDGLTNWVAQRKVHLSLSKEDILFTQGDDVKGIYCHLQGLTKVVQKDPRGKIRFSRLVLPGDTSGHRSLFIAEKYKGTASVLSHDFHACFIPKEDILFLLSSSPSFAKNLVTKISNELSRSEDKAISVREKNVLHRLAILLLELYTHYSDKFENGSRILKSEITKRDIASAMLVANETIIRLMSEMKSEGIITYKDKKIVILDTMKLKKLGRL